MIKIKSIVFCAVLFGALTCVLLFFANNTAAPSSNEIEMLNQRTQEAVRNQLLGAEESLILQARALSRDEKFTSGLSEVREKLLSATPLELKQQSKNTWNSGVFSSLLEWRVSRSTTIKRNMNESGLNETIGSMTSQTPTADWWKKAPNLALAFATVPMKTGELSATLIANGTKGKELHGGKRYDEEVPSLRRVITTQKGTFDLFAWDNKMYFARISPVFHSGNLIGLSVIGMELSNDLPDRLESMLRNDIRILVVYSNPKLGTPGKRVVYASTDSNKVTSDIKKVLDVGRFASSSDETPIRFDEIAPHKVYEEVSGKSGNYLLSRFVWAWNENAQADIYAYFDADISKTEIRRFSEIIIIVCVVGFILALIIILVSINALQNRIQYIRKGFADAMRSGTPMDSDVLSTLMGENADVLGNVNVIRETDPNEESADEEDWSNLMFDFDDAQSAKSDKEMTNDEIEKMKHENDMHEARELFEEYMKARKENNIDTPMDFDCFMRRLHRNVVKIKKTYHCEEVHFEVHVSDGNVLLKPKIVKQR